MLHCFSYDTSDTREPLFVCLCIFPGAFFHSTVRREATTEGNAELLSQKKMKAHVVAVGKGKEGPLFDPGSELLLGGREGGRE